MNNSSCRIVYLIFCVGVLPLAARCQAPTPTDPATGNPRASESHHDSVAPAETPPGKDSITGPGHKPGDAGRQEMERRSAARSERPPPPNSAGPTHLFKFNYAREKKLYFVIENFFTDRGGVPPLLSFSTSTDDKSTVIQTVTALSNGASTPANPGEMTLQWIFDRYEVRERGIKDEVKFDSVRDSYPRAEIRDLGTIPGAGLTFDFNSRTGLGRNFRIEHNKNIGPPTRRRLSRTTLRCALTNDHLAQLMDDLGPLYLPDHPVAVGETWTRTRSETVKSFGRTFLDYTFKLSRITQVEDRQIATIDITGTHRLIPEDSSQDKPVSVSTQPSVTTTPGVPDAHSVKPATPPIENQATSQPAVARASAPPPSSQPVANPAATTRPTKPASNKPKDFRIDNAVCRGALEFDLTRGELVSLDLTRELDLSAGIESEEIKNMRLETGSAHRLRVKVLQTPPPKPIIAGGRTPPADDPPEPNYPGARKNLRNRYNHGNITDQPPHAGSGAGNRPFPATQPVRSKTPGKPVGPSRAQIGPRANLEPFVGPPYYPRRSSDTPLMKGRMTTPPAPFAPVLAPRKPNATSRPTISNHSHPNNTTTAPSPREVEHP